MYRFIGSLCAVVLIFGSARAYPPFFVANDGQWEGEFASRMEAGSVVCYVTSTGLTTDFREVAFPPTSVGGIKGGLGRDEGRGMRSELESPPTPWGDQGGVRGHVLKMNFVEANPHPDLIGQDKLSSYSNYFLGRDSCQWRSFVGHYQRVIAREVWPGIDVEFIAQAEGSRDTLPREAGR